MGRSTIVFAASRREDEVESVCDDDENRPNATDCVAIVDNEFVYGGRPAMVEEP